MFPAQKGQPNTTEGAPDELFPLPPQPVMHPPVSDFNYPYPTEYRASNLHMHPVQVLPMNGDRYEWVDDAPMPPDYVDQPHNSSDSSPAYQDTSSPNSDMSGRTPLVHVRSDEDKNRGETALPASDPSPSNTTNLARLNISSSEKPRESPKPAVIPEERSLIEVHPSSSAAPPRKVPIINNKEIPWVSVFYYEKSSRVHRNCFTADRHSPTVTMGSTPRRTDEKQFSLAYPTSKEARTMAVRNQLAEGIRLENRNGTVWLTVLSKNAVFVHSPFRNRFENEPCDTVVKLKHETNENKKQVALPSIKLFDQALLDQQIAALNESGMEFDDVSSIMRSFCTTNVSFVKGFGGDYNKWITDCVCWVEIHLTAAQQAYHHFLETSSGPEFMGSRS